MNATTRNVVLACIAVLLLGFAGWRMFRPAKDAVHPDTAASVTHWMCDNAGCPERKGAGQPYVQDLTSKQRDEWTRSQDKVRRGAGAEAKRTVFKCPKCQQFSLITAMKCPKHGTWLPATDHLDGRPGTCELCDKEQGGGGG